MGLFRNQGGAPDVGVIVCDTSLVIDPMFYYEGGFGNIKAAAPGIFRGWGKLVADETADRWRRGRIPA